MIKAAYFFIVILLLILLCCGKKKSEHPGFNKPFTYIVIDSLTVKDVNKFKRYCNKDNLTELDLMNSGMTPIEIFNNNYDTIYVNYNNYVCDSFPVVSYSELNSYHINGDSLILIEKSVPCYFGKYPTVKIIKGTSAIFIADVRKNMHVDSYYFESVLSFRFDSLGVRGQLNISIPHNFFNKNK